MFLQVYSSLSDAPDPYPLLEASVDSMLVAEETLPKLTEENQHLQKNVTKLTTQLEEAEAGQQSERASRKELEDSLETKVKEVETSWSAVLEEKKDNWASKEKALEEKVESQDRLLNELKASYEVNQRLGKTAEQDDQDGQGGRVATAEIEMLHSDLERTSSRLAEVEARNEQLRLDLAQSKSQVTTQAPALEDDPKYMRVRSENSSLLRKLDASRVEKEGLKRDLDGRLRSLEREVGHLKEERDALKAKVHKWSDYDNVREELEVLKSIEFSTGDDDEQVGEVPADADRAKGDTLEKLLLARNKKLGDELTILRVSHQDLQARLQELQEELSRTNGDLERAQRLNERLESDLASMQAEAPNAFPSGASVAGTYASRYPSVHPSRKGRISPTSSIISGLDPRTAGQESPGGGGGANAGILPMITAQRDRFKARNSQLETDVSQSHRTISQLRQEIAALQKDNLNLYEKTRYISTYNRAPSATSSSAYAASPNPSTVAIGGGGGGIALERYRKAYESNISPFAAFRGRESARAYRGMSLPERMVYSVTRMVLSSRASRNLFAGYCVALHVLVFLSLYWLGAEESGASLGQSATGAAAAAGAGAGVGAGTGPADQQWREEGGF